MTFDEYKQAVEKENGECQILHAQNTHNKKNCGKTGDRDAPKGVSWINYWRAMTGKLSETYPVVYFGSDTTGEKAFEEFYVPGEKIDMQRFQALGVVEQTTRHEMTEVKGFFEKLEGIFAKEDFTKVQVVEAIKEFIPNFEHEKKGKNLDQKM